MALTLPVTVNGVDVPLVTPVPIVALDSPLTTATATEAPMLLPLLPVAAEPAVTVVVAAFVLSALNFTLLAPVNVTLLAIVASNC